MEFTSFVNGRKILACGTIIIPEDQVATITFGDSNEKNIIHVVFEDKGEGGPDIDMQAINANEANLVLRNHSSPLGSGLSMNFPIANVGNIPVFLSYAAHGLGTLRVFSYTLSLGLAA